MDDGIQCWRMHLQFGSDFPKGRPDGVYHKLISECWRRLPQHHAVTCSPLHIQTTGVCGWVYATQCAESFAAIEDFQRRSRTVICQLRGTPDAVIWEYARVIAEPHPVVEHPTTGET